MGLCIKNNNGGKICRKILANLEKRGRILDMAVIKLPESYFSVQDFPKDTVIEILLPGKIRHVGISGGNGMVVHHCQRGTVHETEAEFAKNAIDGIITQNTTLAGEISPGAYERGLSRVGKDSYDVVNYNCQHFVRWAFGKTPKSPQLQKVGGVALGLAAARYVSPPFGIGATVGTLVTPKDENPSGYAIGFGLLGLAIVFIARNL